MTGTPTNDEKLLRPGVLIAERYEVVRALGSGGMGEVYHVRDLELRGEPLALKVLHKDLSRDEVTFDRFRNEVLLARTLSHANIVRIHDLVRAPEGFYFVTMEYVEGESLATLLTRLHAERAGLPLRAEQITELLGILRELLTAVGFAHRRGIIHRDIKPHNVLRAADGSVKLADFGTARLVSATSELTPTGQVVGTPYYMSPEQIRGEDLDGRSDLYAVGIVAYEMFSGKRPFKGENFVSIVFKHLQEPLPPLSAELAGAPAWLDTVLRTATHKDREMRFANAEQFIAALVPTEPQPAPGGSHEQGGASSLRELPLFEADDERSTRSVGRVLRTLFTAFVLALAGGYYLLSREPEERRDRRTELATRETDLPSATRREEESTRSAKETGADRSTDVSSAEEVGEKLGVPVPELPAVDEPSVAPTPEPETARPSAPPLIGSTGESGQRDEQPQDALAAKESAGSASVDSDLSARTPPTAEVAPETIRESDSSAPPVASPVAPPADTPVAAVLPETSEMPAVIPPPEQPVDSGSVDRTEPLVTIFFRDMSAAAPVEELRKRGTGDFRWTAVISVEGGAPPEYLKRGTPLSLCLFESDGRGSPTICSSGGLLSSAAGEIRLGGTLSRETLKTLSRGAITVQLRAGRETLSERSIQLVD